MKKIIISGFVALLSLSTVAMADDKAAKIDAFKQQFAAQFEKETALINQVRSKEDEIRNQLKSCVLAVKSEADLKACGAAREEAVKKFKMEMEKVVLENQKKAIANEEKRLNDEMKK